MGTQTALSSMYTLDTNAVIYFIRDEEKVVARIREILAQSSPYLSTVTELELFARPNITAEEELALEEALAYVTIVPLFSNTARIAARVRREYGLKTPDSAIAATALVTDTTLVTRNVRDFRRVPGLTVEAI